MSEQCNFSRRALLSTAVGGVAAGFAASASAASPAFARTWDETHELVIVGSGFAGLAAAYEARKNGIKDIKIFERMVSWGGNSALCGGLMCMPGTALQKKHGVKDSPEAMVADMFKAGRGFNHPVLAKTLAENAHFAYDMLVDCGVKFKDKVIRLGGHSAARAHLPENASGGGIVVPMHKKMREAGVKFENRANVVEVIVGSSGAEGLRVQTGFDLASGSYRAEKRVRATRGIIIATGGWGQDNEFVSTTMPVYSQLECTSQPGATATMIKALLAVDALPVMLDMYQLGPWASPDEKGAGPGSFFADYAFAEGIAVDPKTGRRFMNELADRRTRAEAELVVLNKGTKEKPNYPFCFCGEATTKRAEGFKAAYRENTVKRSANVEELARLHGVDPKALKASIDEWNAIVAGKKTDPFGKPLDVKTELKPPFYSMRLTPKLHYCMGGVAINEKAEVLCSQTCRPIPGLYAAGEVTGGTHGMDRLGGCSSVDGLVFGQIAGRSAALRKI